MVLEWMWVESGAMGVGFSFEVFLSFFLLWGCIPLLVMS